MNVMELVFGGDVTRLQELISKNISLANEPIPLPDNPAVAHPLHRICDAVFRKSISEAKGLEIANIFLKNGAQINFNKGAGNDSPLTAACSLHCDNIALLYIEHGADIHHPGCHGGNALHWSAWCGRDKVLRKLLDLKPEINRLCIDFKSTPLFWTVHGYKFGGKENLHNQVECARWLLRSGADPSIPNFEGFIPAQLLELKDRAMREVFGRL